MLTLLATCLDGFPWHRTAPPRWWRPMTALAQPLPKNETLLHRVATTGKAQPRWTMITKIPNAATRRNLNHKALAPSPLYPRLSSTTSGMLNSLLPAIYSSLRLPTGLPHL